MTKVAVTGACGRVGSRLVLALLAAGYEVLAIDRAPWSGELPQGVSFVQLDVGNSLQLAKALAGSTMIVHLAGLPSPVRFDNELIYRANVLGTHSVLRVAAEEGLSHVCIASSVNAIGGAYSAAPRYDRLPLDEDHPSYVEDAYGLSKWIGEQEAAATARRNPDMCVASFRLHFSVPDRATAVRAAGQMGEMVWKHLWGYVTFDAINEGVVAALGAKWRGHEVFYIVAPRTVSDEASEELAAKFYPEVPIVRPLRGTEGFFDCSKARRMLHWGQDVEGRGGQRKN